MDKLIGPAEQEWSPDGAEAAAIGRWEQEQGVRLPDDYRGFLVRYNGGRPYPNMFRHTALSADDDEALATEHLVDPFYPWQRVLDWSKELGSRLPPQCLSIGADPGLIEIVLSLRPEDYGAVYSWVRNRGAWGSEENRYLCPQAPSFRAFVASLNDDAEKAGYDYWSGNPHNARLQRKLEL